MARLNRRDALKTGSATLAAAWAHMAAPGFVFPGQEEGERAVPFLDTPKTKPYRLKWQQLDEWMTPPEQVFSVSHYGQPDIDPSQHRLEITGLVDRPRTLGMNDIRSLPKEDLLMTLECSGNGASKTFMDAIYNANWSGTLLAPLLNSCGLKPEAKEIVFLAADKGKETVRKGTRRELTFEAPFGRSLSVDDALNAGALLAYEQNGKPLEKRNGGPLRLIVPGWYGIACVKWVNRIEVRDRRYMGRFMGRDYVTIRGERRDDGRIVYTQTSVTRVQLKSLIARVTRGETSGGAVPVKAYGAAWSDGTPIDRVEVQVDGGPWRPATLDDEPRSKYCWTFFSVDLGGLKPGKHTLVSRAVDATGRVQPAAEDDEIALKQTYWEAYQQWPREIELEA